MITLHSSLPEGCKGNGKKMRLFVIFVWVLLSATAARADLFEKIDTPDWIEQTPVPEMNPDHIAYVTGGIYYLLVDKQIRWVGERRQIYVHIVKKILNRKGLENAGSLSFEIDPSFEVMNLVSLSRSRDGVKEELKDQVTFRVFQRETDLERGIIDGGQTIYTDLTDVRVGDVIETEVIWDEQPRYKGSTFSDGYWLEYSVPVGLTQVLLHWPNDRPVFFQPMLDQVEYSKEEGDETTAYRWRRGDIIPPPLEDAVPAGYRDRAYISYSAYNNWDEVAAAFRDDYNQPQKLSDEWLAKIDQIRKNYTDPSEQVVAALRLVQNEIRYVGIEIGKGGYVARDPQTVIRQGFGDCKDKSLLLKTTLAELGVHSVVALANLKLGHQIVNRLPSGNAFDHMIVGAQLDGQTVWMDPTASYEGGRTTDQLVIPDYGYVLPLGQKDKASIVQISPNAKTADRVEILEMFIFSDLGVLLGVNTEYTGEAATNQRAYWQNEAPSVIRQRYFDYYAQNYPGLRKSQETRVIDDPDNNVFRVVESYFLPQADFEQKELQEDFPFREEDYLSSLENLRAHQRRNPMAIPYQFQRTHRVVVKRAPIEFRAPDMVVIDNPAFSFKFEGTSSDGGGMELKWTLHTKTRQVPPDVAPDVIRDIRRMHDNNGYAWNLTQEE